MEKSYSLIEPIMETKVTTPLGFSPLALIPKVSGIQTTPVTVRDVTTLPSIAVEKSFEGYEKGIFGEGPLSLGVSETKDYPIYNYPFGNKQWGVISKNSFFLKKVGEIEGPSKS